MSAGTHPKEATSDRIHEVAALRSAWKTRCGELLIECDVMSHVRHKNVVEDLLCSLKIDFFPFPEVNVLYVSVRVYVCVYGSVYDAFYKFPANFVLTSPTSLAPIG